MGDKINVCGDAAGKEALMLLTKMGYKALL
jgi:phosphoenolpyruvate-protein kinase (PTS system EI component)